MEIASFQRLIDLRVKLGHWVGPLKDVILSIPELHQFIDLIKHRKRLDSSIQVTPSVAKLSLVLGRVGPDASNLELQLEIDPTVIQEENGIGDRQL